MMQKPVTVEERSVEETPTASLNNSLLEKQKNNNNNDSSIDGK